MAQLKKLLDWTTAFAAGERGPTGKTIVLVHSAMRSGSTLLKALLGVAPDISHLPEVKFRRIMRQSAGSSRQFYRSASEMADERIIVLKCPFWTDETPRTDIRQMTQSWMRNIALVRSGPAVCTSIERMFRERSKPEMPIASLVDYWCTATSYVLDHILPLENTILVRYEDLVLEPEQQTYGVFQFVGSTQNKGVATYHAPSEFNWQWGLDDAGSQIKTLRVQRNSPVINENVLHAFHQNERAKELMTRIGYQLS